MQKKLPQKSIGSDDDNLKLDFFLPLRPFLTSDCANFVLSTFCASAQTLSLGIPKAGLLSVSLPSLVPELPEWPR
jgi:hypothetical protein